MGEDLNYNIVDIVTNAKDALTVVQNHKLDLIFMDINIHGPIDGLQCAVMINEISKIPIIYLTAYNDTATITEASLTNIYGFVTKPFDNKDIEIALSVAIARIKQEKPNIKEKNPIIKLNNDYFFNIETQILTYLNEHVKLTKTETKLMLILSMHQNNLVSLIKIHTHVYNSLEKSDSTLRDLISRLRKKTPHLTITNVHGMGYCLKTS